MYMSSNALVSNSDMIKNYKKCREKAEGLGRVFILKYNEPDAVLFSIREYEKLSKSVEQVKRNGAEEIAKINESLRKQRVND